MASEDDLHHRDPLLREQPGLNAVPVILGTDRAVGVQRPRDALPEPGQRLAGRVVDHLLHDAQRVVGPGVRRRPLLDGLEAPEDADGGFGARASSAGGYPGCYGDARGDVGDGTALDGHPEHVCRTRTGVDQLYKVLPAL